MVAFARRVARGLRRRVGRLRRALGRFPRPRLPVGIGRYRPPSTGRPLAPDEQAVVDAFHVLAYQAWRGQRGTLDLAWFGHRTLKNPMDLWIYQEILVETRPDVVVETGTAFGGSALFLASMLDLLGEGRVISVDLNARDDRPTHPRITYVIGSSVDPTIVARVRRETAGRRTMVILDSDHHQPHVEAELAIYREFVSPGCYLIVEDTNINGHPVRPDFGPGPHEALAATLASLDSFEPDLHRERFMLTSNPGGYLRRKA